MYGLWYITIVAFVFLIIVIIGLIFATKKNKNGNNDTSVILGIIAVVVNSVFFIIILACSILNPIDTKKEYAEFENTREIVQNAYENGTPEDNYAITQSIIESNEWLAKAKASKSTWGCFSMYCYIDLENVEPITINNGNIEEEVSR